jgi:hypothetical protein
VVSGWKACQNGIAFNGLERCGEAWEARGWVDGKAALEAAECLTARVDIADNLDRLH